ncbi:unnamed protein product [Somion occarium]|uniref:DUF295 domain-containing protein n=1 Tax=Somion occarium TaxID=3059160 RepID=A0ABP1CUB6_9APHY
MSCGRGRMRLKGVIEDFTSEMSLVLYRRFHLISQKVYRLSPLCISKCRPFDVSLIGRLSDQPIPCFPVLNVVPSQLSVDGKHPRHLHDLCCGLAHSCRSRTQSPFIANVAYLQVYHMYFPLLRIPHHLFEIILHAQLSPAPTFYWFIRLVRLAMFHFYFLLYISSCGREIRNSKSSTLYVVDSFRRDETYTVSTSGLCFFNLPPNHVDVFVYRPDTGSLVKQLMSANDGLPSSILYYPTVLDLTAFPLEMSSSPSPKHFVPLDEVSCYARIDSLPLVPKWLH